MSEALPLLDWDPSLDRNGHYGLERGRRRLYLARAFPNPTILKPGWPIWAFILGLPVWWALGMSLQIAPLIGLAMLAALMLRGQVRTAPGFGIWLMFLGIMLLSAVQIDDLDKFVAFLYRGFWYISCTLLFLYVLTIPKEVLPSRTIVKAMAIFFVVLTVGGFLGMFFPSVDFVTPVETLLPKSLLANVFVYDSTHASLAGDKAYRGLGIYRPKPFFAYTNQWGATFALVLPFALGAVEMIRSQLWKKLLVVTVLLSVAPLVSGLNRGSWLSAGAVMAYAFLLLALRRKSSVFGWLLVGGLLMAGVLFVSGLSEAVSYRLETAQSNASRQYNYVQSVELASESPWLGYGGTVETPEVRASIGTQGQFWTVMVSNGIPALILFILWFLWCFIVSWRKPPAGSGADEKVVFWSHIVLFSAFTMLVYYEWLPYGFAVVMIAAALVWREILPDRTSAQASARERALAALPAHGGPA